MYLTVKYSEYKRFMESNGSDRIAKGLKLTYNTTILPSFVYKYKVNEVFNVPKKTSYEIEINKKYPIKNVTHRISSFRTDSDTKYRIDIFTRNDLNDIAFSLYEKDPNIVTDNEYEKLTDKNESIEVLSRISYIVSDMIDKNEISKNFCIGVTKFDKKNRIYEHLLKILGAIDIKKEKTNVYPEGCGLFFIIDKYKYIDEEITYLNKQIDNQTETINSLGGSKDWKLKRKDTTKERNRLIELKEEYRNNKIDEVLRN